LLRRYLMLRQTMADLKVVQRSHLIVALIVNNIHLRSLRRVSVLIFKMHVAARKEDKSVLFLKPASKQSIHLPNRLCDPNRRSGEAISAFTAAINSTPLPQ